MKEKPVVVIIDDDEFLTKDVYQVRLPNVFSQSKVVGFTSFDPHSAPFQRIKDLAFDCREKPSGIMCFLQLVSDYVRPQPRCV